jgi:hypothetical protein
MLAAFLSTPGMLACVPARRRRQLTGAGVPAHIGVNVCQGSPVSAALAGCEGRVRAACLWGRAFGAWPGLLAAESTHGGVVQWVLGHGGGNTSPKYSISTEPPMETWFCSVGEVKVRCRVADPAPHLWVLFGYWTDVTVPLGSSLSRFVLRRVSETSASPTFSATRPARPGLGQCLEKLLFSSHSGGLGVGSGPSWKETMTAPRRKLACTVEVRSHPGQVEGSRRTAQSMFRRYSSPQRTSQQQRLATPTCEDQNSRERGAPGLYRYEAPFVQCTGTWFPPT